MNISDLRAFLHLAATLHFGKTSRECFMTPSTLSRIIQRLEEEVGTPLFDRTNRRVALTQAGIDYQQFATATLAHWETLHSQMSPKDTDVRGQLRLFCSVTAGYSILPPILSRFRARHPHVQIELLTGDVELALHHIYDNKVDIAIGSFSDNIAPTLSRNIFMSIPLVFVNNAPLSTTPNWEDTSVILPITGLSRHYVEDWFQQQRISPTISARVSGFEGILALVSVGYGIGVVPQIVVEHSILRHQIHIINIQPSLPALDVGICVKTQKRTLRIIDSFWECCY